MPIDHVAPEQSASVGRYLDTVRRRKRVALMTSISCLAISLAFVSGLPDLYRASATVIVDQPTSEAIDPTTPSDEINSRLQKIKTEALSRSRLEDLANRFALYSTPLGPMSVEARVALLTRDITIQPVTTERASGPAAVAFRITYTGRNPQTVAGVANALASFYLAQNEHMRTKQVTQTANVLEEQLAAEQKKLQSQEDRIRAYTMANMGNLPQQADANLAALERLNTLLRANGDEQIRLMDRRQTLQHDIAELSTRQAPDPNDPAVKLEQLQRQLATLKSQWTEEYSEVKQTRAQIAQVEQQLAASGRDRSDPVSSRDLQRSTLEASLAETESNIEKLKRESQGLQTSIAGYEHRVENAPIHQPGFDAVNREYQAARDRYDALLKRYDQATLAERVEDSTSGEFRVLESAIPPSDPAGPNRTRLLILAVALSLMLGVAAVLVLDYFDTSFHSVDDLRAFTRVPVLASIPVISSPQGRIKQGVRASFAAVASGAALVLLALGAFQVAHGSEQLARLLLRV